MRLNKLYAKFLGQFQFYVIYIRQAHPQRGWQVPNNLIYSNDNEFDEKYVGLTMR